MVKGSLFQMMLWKQLGMKRTIKLTYCTTVKYPNDSDIRMYFKEKQNDIFFKINGQPFP